MGLDPALSDEVPNIEESTCRRIKEMGLFSAELNGAPAGRSESPGCRGCGREVCKFLLLLTAPESRAHCFTKEKKKKKKKKSALRCSRKSKAGDVWVVFSARKKVELGRAAFRNCF